MSQPLLSKESKQAELSQLKLMLRQTEEHNDVMAVQIARTKLQITRARLERTILREWLERAVAASAASESVKDEGNKPDLESPPESPLPADSSTSAALAFSGKSDRREEPRKRQTPRDPRLPKRPQNPYLIFQDRERENIRSQLEASLPAGVELPDLNKAMSDAWKSVGQKGRRLYNDLYKDDRLRYLREMAAFPSTGLSATDQKEKQRAVKQLRLWEAGQANNEPGEPENDNDNDNEHEHDNEHENDNDSEKPEKVEQDLPIAERDNENETEPDYSMAEHPSSAGDPPSAVDYASSEPEPEPSRMDMSSDELESDPPEADMPDV